MHIKQFTYKYKISIIAKTNPTSDPSNVKNKQLNLAKNKCEAFNEMAQLNTHKTKEPERFTITNIKTIALYVQIIKDSHKD